jgi:hypothetical protein
VAGKFHRYFFVCEWHALETTKEASEMGDLKELPFINSISEGRS